MPEFNPFDMDFDGDVDGINFLGFHYLMRRVMRTDRDQEEVRDDDDSWEDEMSDDLSA